MLYILWNLTLTHELLNYLESQTTDIACTYLVVSIQGKRVKIIKVKENPSIICDMYIFCLYICRSKGDKIRNHLVNMILEMCVYNIRKN